MLLQNGSLSIGSVAGDTALVVNQSGAAWDLAGDVSILNVGAGLFTNNGTLAKADGTRVSTLAATLNNAGVLNVDYGTLDLTGASDALGGIIGGDSALELSGGSDTIESGLQLVTATMEIASATVTLGPTLSYVGNLYFESGALDLNAYNLVTYNTVDFTGRTVSGTGFVATAGSTALNNMTLTAGAGFSNNAGALTQRGLLYLGAGAGDATNAINQSGATWIFSGYDNGIIGTGTATFTNAGTLSENALIGNGCEITASFVNVGTIQVSNGYVELGGPSDALGGTISGAGGIYQFAGTATLEAGLTLTVAQVIVGNGAVLALAANESYADQFYDSSALALGAFTFALSGAADQIFAIDITGTGSLTTSGTLTINSTLSSTVDLVNTGLMQITGGLADGAVTGDAPVITNASTGTLDLLNNGSITGLGFGTVVNQGVIVAANSATGTIAPALTNTGGTADLQFAGTGLSLSSFTFSQGAHGLTVGHV